MHELHYRACLKTNEVVHYFKNIIYLRVKISAKYCRRKRKVQWHNYFSYWWYGCRIFPWLQKVNINVTFRCGDLHLNLRRRTFCINSLKNSNFIKNNYRCIYINFPNYLDIDYLLQQDNVRVRKLAFRTDGVTCNCTKTYEKRSILFLCSSINSSYTRLLGTRNSCVVTVFMRCTVYSIYHIRWVRTKNRSESDRKMRHTAHTAAHCYGNINYVI